jgi:hypothetical protein
VGAGLIATITVASTVFYLQNNKAADETRSRVTEEMGEYKYKDAEKYSDRLNEFAEAEEKALAPLRDTSLTDQKLAEKLQKVSLPEWDKAEQAIVKTKGYNVSDKSK